jgi:hypothetical protein
MMTPNRLTVVILFLFYTPVQGDPPATNAAPSLAPAPQVDPIVKASAYGDKTVWSYSSDHPLPWTLFHPNDFSTIPVQFDGTGVTPLGEVPAPGVHPRLFFSPDDLPALRRRLKETRAGQEAWKNVLSYANTLKLKYDPAADYAKPDWMNGSFFIHGRVPLYLVGGYADREDFYQELINGQKPSKDFTFMPLAAVEAFRCLIDEDHDGAQTLAKAVVHAIQFEEERRQKEEPPLQPGQPPKPSTQRLWAISLGMVYDFIYNDLTADQKKILHDELVTLSAWQDNYGTFNNADASRSNWATFSYWAFDLMAIEGEPGFNDLKFRGLYRGWRNYFATSIFQSGAVFEGEGKTLLGLDAVAAFDRAAPKYHLQPLSWHPAIRRFYEDFALRSMLPNRTNFVQFDMLGNIDGGLCTPIDAVMAKYFYPKDKGVDLVYHAVVGDDYKTMPNRCDWTWNMVVLCAIFATDYDPDNSPEKMGAPLSFFCGQRAVMMTRSSWDADATFLTMHVRGASGGHPYRDRNGIMLAAAGRGWIRVPFDHGQDNGWMCNTVLIDGCEQENTTPGRCVDYVDKPQATFMVGDAKYCWDWVWSNATQTLDGKTATADDVARGNIDTGAGWKLVDQCFNDFAYTRQDALAYTRPLKFAAHWLAPDGAISAVTRQVNIPVLKAFRTTGLVRGAHPYVLVVDDIQRSALPSKYDWNIMLCDDVVQATVPPDGAQPGDIFLAGKTSVNSDGSLQPKEPALLVRVLEEKGAPQPPSLAVRDQANIFTLSTRAVSPDFKVLLYPFHAGDSLPTTNWDSAHTTVTLSYPVTDPAPEDQILFSPSDSGKTDLRITRNREEIVRVSAPIPKFTDPASDALDAQLAQLPADVEAARGYQPDQEPGLIASWSFDQIASGGFPATQPGLAPIPADDATVEPGLIGNAVRPAKAGLTIPLDLHGKADTSLTVAFWLKADANPDGSIIELLDNRAFSLDLVQGRLRFNAQGQWFYGGTNSISTLNHWTHLAVTWDGQTINLYRDGTLLMTLPGTRKMEYQKTIFLAKSGVAGLYDDLRIYNRALDAATVRKLALQGAQAQ